MKQTLLFLFSSLSMLSFSQDSASVLFIGNSYTTYNNLPQMVADLAASQGDFIEKSSNTPGGATFEVHSNNATNYNLINSQAWDYVVLQAQSQEPSFPDNQVNTNTLPFAVQLADSIYANNFCSEVLFYMTWGRETGDPQWQPISTYNGMQERLRNAYMRFADSVQGAVSPVGMAWKHVRDNHPGIQLYIADGSHPSLEGSYLAACTFYASIFRKPSVGATYLNGVDPMIAAQLQAAADFVVLDSLDQWNLREISEHTQADFTFTIGPNGVVSFDNNSSKAQTYSWDFGDGQASTDENPTVTYTANGNYTVTLTSTSPCDDDVISYQVDVNTLSLLETSFDLISLKSFGDGNFTLVSDATILQVAIIDAAGNHVTTINSSEIDLSQSAPGFYLLQVQTDRGAETIKVVR
jgi:hypothetical protein